MMKWMSKNSKPENAGWHYVRLEKPKSGKQSKVNIRYFDDSNGSWWGCKSDGMYPNDFFSEWLLISSLNQLK